MLYLLYATVSEAMEDTQGLCILTNSYIMFKMTDLLKYMLKYIMDKNLPIM